VSIENQYITETEYSWVINDLNLDVTDSKKEEILKRATADLESKLAKKFIVPLVAVQSGTNLALDYSSSPEFARMKILNALKAAIKSVIGFDQNRTLTGTIDSAERFMNVHADEFKSHMKDLLDPMVDFGFKLQPQAMNAQDPVQSIGLARANNRTRIVYDDCY
jgi:small nuclear ribonucleoprotein (snRNP)-like protein